MGTMVLLAFGVFLSVASVALSVFLAIHMSMRDRGASYERDRFVLVGSLICMVILASICWYGFIDRMVKPIDVYRGYTELKIEGEFIDGSFVPKDSTVVWKER